MDIKYCPSCKETRPVDLYCNNRSTKDGLAAYCKQCHYSRYSTWRESLQGDKKTNRREQESVARKKYKANNPDQDGLYYETNKTRIRESQVGARLISRYGITLEDYNKMLAGQNHGCGICGTSSPKGRGKRFHVDHDHATGQVRGLLCPSCNLKLGVLDNSEWCEKARRYLGEQ